ncbi:uncharacterized protein ARMOST_14176 [Armillaria ostoyae]|uniref:Uncharacterized protein n=1 Tax=Armillaria ostoyae TaxID=47428 RepID=A0A284RPS1_ARMOS|nr:uncharacterized protein ARMOST_14176 [Armillaria ostoyae]
MPLVSSILQLLRNQLHSKDRYRLVVRLQGHRRPINCIVFTPSAKTLASGGDDETVKIWCLEKASCSQTLCDNLGRWGQITCMLFIGKNGDWLLFGTGRGLLLIYGCAKGGLYRPMCILQVSEGSDPVESLCFDHHSSRIAIGSHYGDVKVYKVELSESRVETTLDWSRRMAKSIPRSMAFINEGKDMLVFGLNTGDVYAILNVCVYEMPRDYRTYLNPNKKGEITGQKLLEWPIGNATVNDTEKMVLVHNIAKGFDLYGLPTLSLIHSMITRKKTCIIKDVKFGEDSSVAIGGSDHGTVYVLNLETAVIEQELRHGNSGEFIQAVDASSSSEGYLIASGGGSSVVDPDVCLWEKPTRLTISRRRGQSRTQDCLGVLIALTLIAFLCQSSGGWSALVRNFACTCRHLWPLFTGVKVVKDTGIEPQTSLEIIRL